MEQNSQISKEEFQKCIEGAKKIYKYLDSKIVGQQRLKNALVIVLISDGHILLESVPGLAKTTAAQALANSIRGAFSRIQCTPDLLPSDITGYQVFNQETRTFETIQGPVFANIVLLDEINRSNAKTQSAMLEVMQERQVTIGGQTYRVPGDIFTVIATQNPIEQEGTYPLSEAQTDRFMIKETIEYPTIDEEVAILNLMESKTKSEDCETISVEEIDEIQDVVEKIFIDDSIKRYIAAIINATRYPDKCLDSKIASYIKMGASPRASIAFMKTAKAYALLSGRTYVIPEDIKAMSSRVLRHRIALNYSAIIDGVTVESIIDSILNVVPTP